MADGIHVEYDANLAYDDARQALVMFAGFVYSFDIMLDELLGVKVVELGYEVQGCKAKARHVSTYEQLHCGCGISQNSHSYSIHDALMWLWTTFSDLRMHKKVKRVELSNHSCALQRLAAQKIATLHLHSRRFIVQKAHDDDSRSLSHTQSAQ